MIDHQHFYKGHMEMDDIDAEGEVWLVAMHAVYESNRAYLGWVLRELRKRHGAVRAVVSSERLKRDSVLDVFPGSSSEMPLSGRSGRAQLGRLSAWRRQLAKDLSDVESSTPEKRSLVSNYLTRIPVTWTSGSPFVLTDSPQFR